MVVRRETNGVGVPITPREGLDRVCRIIQTRSEDSAVADALSNLSRERVEEGLYDSPRVLRVERGVATRKLSAARSEHVVAQGDVLARDIGLVLTTAIVETDDAAVGGRSLRPVDPPAFECELLGRMVTRWQVGDERCDLPGHVVHDCDTRAVVVPVVLMGRLIGIACEQPSAASPVDEGDVDRRSGGLEPAPSGCRLAQRPTDLLPVLVEYQDVRCEGIVYV